MAEQNNQIPEQESEMITAEQATDVLLVLRLLGEQQRVTYDPALGMLNSFQKRDTDGVPLNLAKQIKR